MSAKTITYEQPLNERIRQFLRLEHLFQQAACTIEGESNWQSRHTLSCLTDILEILSRNDIKTDVLKFLERLQINLAQLRGSDAVDRSQLDRILEQVDEQYRNLHSIQGKLAPGLVQHHLISSLLQRGAVTAGVNSFDIPQFHFWLQQSASDRIATLQAWYDELNVLQQPIELILELIRASAEPSTVKTEQGFYHQSLDTSRTYHLIRVTIPADTPYFAEISGGRHRISVRFLHAQDSERPVQAQDDISFQLSCCAL